MRSYKLIIADDEPMIRKGLVSSIHWEELGFEVTADFMDGQDVIDYLQDHEADVVFTDVQMCQVSGLEVARWIRERGLPVKLVMISGYKEFAYIKEAMRLEVKDYILKPLDPAEIRSVFGKVKKELDMAAAGYSRSMDTLLSLREDKACAQVLEAEKALAETLITGNNGAFTMYRRQWCLAMQEVKKDYIPLLVLDMVDAAYNQLEESGILMEGSIQKEQILRRVGVTAREDLLREMRGILQEIFENIKYKKSTTKESVIAKAKHYIEDHLSENFSVDELAAHVYLNRSYFSREFKEETGESVMDYILNRRMEKAIQLIKDGVHSTKTIAGLVGYSDIKYFQRVFKKYTGYTVREYRNLVR